MDYSHIIFSQGIVCLNTNNNAYCVVIDGARGTSTDRCSLVLEIGGELGFMLHTPPNRALVPTGEVRSLEALANVLKKYVCDCEPQDDCEKMTISDARDMLRCAEKAEENIQEILDKQKAENVVIKRHMLVNIGATVFRLKNFIDSISID